MNKHHENRFGFGFDVNGNSDEYKGWRMETVPAVDVSHNGLGFYFSLLSVFGKDVSQDELVSISRGFSETCQESLISILHPGYRAVTRVLKSLNNCVASSNRQRKGNYILVHGMTGIRWRNMFAVASIGDFHLRVLVTGGKISIGENHIISPNSSLSRSFLDGGYWSLRNIRHTQSVLFPGDSVMLFNREMLNLLNISSVTHAMASRSEETHFTEILDSLASRNEVYAGRKSGVIVYYD